MEKVQSFVPPIFAEEPVQEVKDQALAPSNEEIMAKIINGLDQSQRLDLCQKLLAEELTHLSEHEAQKGYKEGFEKGQKDGEMGAEKQLAERLLELQSDNEAQLARFESLFRAIDGLSPQIALVNEEQMVDLALKACFKLVGQALGTKTQVTSLVQQVAKEFAEEVEVQLCLSAADWAMFEEASKAKDLELGRMKVTSSPEIEPGDYQIVIPTGKIECLMEENLAQVSQMLKQNYTANKEVHAE